MGQDPESTAPRKPGKIYREAGQEMYQRGHPSLEVQLTRPLVKILSILFAAVFSPTPVWAQAAPSALSIQRSSKTNQAIFVTAPGGGPIVVRAPAGNGAAQPIDFLKEHGAVFGIQDATQELTVGTVKIDRLANRHTTFHQVYRGIPVFSGTLKVHQNAAGQFIAANGRYHPIAPNFDLVPTIDIQQAQQTALARVLRGAPRVIESELTIVDPGWYGDPNRGTRLAYRFVLYDQLAAVCEGFFIDAHTGEVLDEWDMIQHAKNRFIYDGQAGFDLPGVLARGEGDPPASLSDVNRAYDYYGDVYDYYTRAFGRDSIDGMGLNMVATVNSLAPGCPNAYWDGVSLQMVFCDGAVTDDIVGHELTHGVTQFTANLIYQNQSGQLNESCSDIFGELVDLFNGNAAFVGQPNSPFWPATPTGPGLDTPNIIRGASTCSPGLTYPNGVRWLIGEDAIEFANFVPLPLRDMWNPPCDGISPDYANSPYQVCYVGDAGGVHIGSGVPNHAFAMLTDGATFRGYTITGIGPIKSGAVWYRALTTYFTEISDFEDAYHALNQAAADLIGTFPNDPRTGQPSNSAFTADDAVQVDLALRAVEMNTTGTCGQTADVLSDRPPPICSLRKVIFQDNFENGVNGWTPSNSGAGANPYNWIQSSSLPYHRLGTAWFSPDPSPTGCTVGSVGTLNSLTSPSIVLPASLPSPTLAFTHLISTESQFDGGNVRISVNGGAFNLISRSAFRFNAYNGRVRSTAEGNVSTNGIQGQQSFAGQSAHWGTSIIDLTGLVAGGNSIQIRFDIGRDVCGGALGWLIDDFEIYTCPDCNSNNTIDDKEYSYVNTFNLVSLAGLTFQTFTLTTPPHARGDVTLKFTAMGDYYFDTDNSSPNGITEDEYLKVYIGIGPDYLIGNLFLQNEGHDCTDLLNPDLGEIVLTDSDFNSILDYVTTSPKVYVVTSGSEVNGSRCGTYNFVGMDVQFSGRATDCNNNGRADRLDIEQRFSQDVNQNAIPDECECDCNHNSIPDVSELADHTATDCNLDGVLDACQGGPAAGIDCNGNLIPDSCDIAEGIAADCNSDGIPDECLPVLAVDLGPDVTVEFSSGQNTVQIGGGLAVLGGVFPFEFTYSWEIVSPSSNSGSFDDKHHRAPSFRPFSPGDYVLRCTVRDLNTNGCTNYDELTVHILGLRADAGPDRLGCVDQPTLPFGGDPVAVGGIPPYSYTWTVLSGGANFPGDLADDEHPTYTPKSTSDHVIRVSVQDSAATPNTATDTATLRVGENLIINIKHPDHPHPILTVGEVYEAGAGFEVSGGIPPYIYDWTVLSGPGGSFSGADPANPNFSSNAPGSYIIRLTVTDQGGCLTQTQFTLTVVTNPPSSKVPVGVEPPAATTTVCGVGLCGPTGVVSLLATLAGMLALRPYRRRRR